MVGGVPLRGRHRRIVRWYGTLMDIEDRKRAEEEREKLRQLEDHLAHITRVTMLGEMAASLAHEIKQPIPAAIITANTCVEWPPHDSPNLELSPVATAALPTYG